MVKLIQYNTHILIVLITKNFNNKKKEFLASYIPKSINLLLVVFLIKTLQTKIMIILLKIVKFLTIGNAQNFMKKKNQNYLNKTI